MAKGHSEYSHRFQNGYQKNVPLNSWYLKNLTFPLSAWDGRGGGGGGGGGVLYMVPQPATI